MYAQELAVNKTGLLDSHLAVFQQGGLTYEAINRSSGKPETYTRILRCGEATLLQSGYTAFVRTGDEWDLSSSPIAMTVSEAQGQKSAEGWRCFMLEAGFQGWRGRVQCVSNGNCIQDSSVRQLIPNANDYFWIVLSSGNCTLR